MKVLEEVRAWLPIVDRVIGIVACVMFVYAYIANWEVRELLVFAVLWIVAVVGIEADRTRRGET